MALLPMRPRENKNSYTIENDLLKIIVSSKGGRPYFVQLKKYKTFDQKPLILLKAIQPFLDLIFIHKTTVPLQQTIYILTQVGKDSVDDCYR